MKHRDLWVCYCVLVLLVGTLVLVFEPFMTALAVCGVLAAPAVVALLELWRFDRVGMLFMFLLSNLFLLHKYIAIRRSNGTNIVGIRDIVFLLFICIGLVRGRGRLGKAARHPLIWPGVACLCLVPFALIVGMINGGTLHAAIPEVYGVSGWLVPLVVLANVRDETTMRRLTGFFVAMGVVVALGSIVEVASFGQVRLVSSLAQSFITGVRVWPDGWVFIIVAFGYAVAALGAGKNFLVWGGLALLSVLSFALIQQRGPVVACAGSALVLFALCLWRRPRWISRRRVLSPVLALIGAVGVAFAVVSALYGAGRVLQVAGRYTTAKFSEDASGREFELRHVLEKLETHPITGMGFGARYYDNKQEMLSSFLVTYTTTGTAQTADLRSFVHNVSGYYLLKFGPVGLALLFIFFLQIGRTLFRFVKRGYDSHASVQGLGLSLGLLALIVEAQAANVFGDPKQLPVAGFAIGLLACYERLYEARSRSTELPAGRGARPRQPAGDPQRERVLAS